MNLAYFKFQFINSSRRKSIWISFAIFLFTVSAFLLIVPAIGKLNPLQAWAQPTMVVCQTFVSLIASIFCAILAINIFKDPQEDGSDLIIIAKPVKKINVILTKLLVYLLYCLIANLAAIFITFFIILIPKMEYQYYWKLLFSLFIGNTVSFTLFGSIAILLTTKLSKMGVMIVNVCIALVFLVYQIVGVFVVPTPTKTLLENTTPAHTYIIQNRNFETGEYKEEEIVSFETTALETDIKKDFSNWQGMEQYWKDVKKSVPTTTLNVTDLASMISYSYLSGGLQQYSDRQAQRFFGSSTRAYDYNLTCPASPEVLDAGENKKSIPFIYLNEKEFKIPLTETKIYLPDRYGFAAIKAETEAVIKGISNFLPIGYLKTQEINSSSDVLFEPEQWVKYSKPFEIMYSHCFEYDLGIGKTDYYTNDLDDSIKFYKTFASSNSNLAKMFELIWACLTGRSSEEKYFGSADPLKEYNKEYFDISTAKDLNTRFLQFKYFTLIKAQQIQEKLIKNGYIWENSKFEKEAREKAILEMNETIADYYLNLENVSTNSWFIKDKQINPEYITILQPHTQTVSFTTLNISWDKQKELMTEEGLSGADDEWIDNATNCALYKILQAGEIVKQFAMPKEKYLFGTVDSPERTSDNIGAIYSDDNHWTSYLETMAVPGGQNIQLFYYSSDRKYDYWWFAVAWLALSLLLISGAVLIYNKYDIK